MDNFRAWLEYTFDAEDDMNLDVSFRTACHWIPFTTIKTNGSSSYGKPREEGGFLWILPNVNIFNMEAGG